MLPISPDLARSALEAAPDAILILDHTGIIQFANRQVSALFGYPHDEIIGQSVEQFMPERFRALHIVHREQYNGNVRVRPMGVGLELIGRRQDGSEFPIEISLSPVEDGSRVLVAAAIRDVSDRKRVEAELMVAREVAESAREIAIQASESADRSNQGKSRFLATASHDLRQPLQTLALLNGALRRIVTDPDAADALSHQEHAINAMSRLLNALLDISKLESGAIKPEPIDFMVTGLLEELRNEFASLAEKKGLELQIDTCFDWVYSDPSLVDQILRNLLSNAIKYTPTGWVRLRCLHEATSIRLEVLDSGVGIPEDKIPYIYDEFYQVGVPTNSARDGYGLGLSIVLRLVKLLKLKLDVSSTVGVGSTFSLTLPASAARTASISVESKRPPAHESQIGRPRVLLVEDDPGVRRATKMLLMVEGYLVTALSSREEALQHVRENPGVDLLVTDYHLSDGETGTEVIAALREALGFPLKAVLMTGDTSAAIKELTGDPYLRMASKPVRAEELLTLLRALLTT